MAVSNILFQAFLLFEFLQMLFFIFQKLDITNEFSMNALDSSSANIFNATEYAQFVSVDSTLLKDNTAA
jgi:hypothetical protein